MSECALPVAAVKIKKSLIIPIYNSSRDHINSLTSIRIFAALLVVLSHLKLAKLTSYTWLS